MKLVWLDRKDPDSITRKTDVIGKKLHVNYIDDRQTEKLLIIREHVCLWYLE
jgi:hypothetical protein